MSFLLVRALALLLISWLLFHVMLAGLGSLSAHILRLRLTRWVHRCWLGIATTIAILQIGHFFFPIRGQWLGAMAVLSAIGWCLWATQKLPTPPRRWSGFSWILFALCALWLADRAIASPNNFDTGLYHQSTIRWFSAYPIVPGLGNLHGRLAFNNSCFLLYAMADCGPWAGHAGSIVCGSLLTLLLFQAIGGIDGLQQRDSPQMATNVFDALLLVPLLALACQEGAVASPTGDLPANVIGLATASMAFALFGSNRSDDREHNAQRVLLAILLATAICLKLSLVFYAGLVGLAVCVEGLLLFRETMSRGLLLCVAIATFMLIGPWLLRGVVLSGYPLYPSRLFGAAVSWKVTAEQARMEQAWITSWARRPAPPLIVHNDWKWLGGWARSYLTSARETMYLPLGLCLILLPVAVRRSFWRRPQMLLAISVVAALSLWLFIAPDARFAVFLFWSLAAAMLALAFTTEQGARLKHSTALLLIACLCAIVFLDPTLTIALRQHVNPFTAFKRFALIPADPAMGFHPMPAVELIDSTTRSGLHVWVPAKGDQCWDAPLPSAPKINPNVRLRHDGDLGGGFVVDPADAPAQTPKF